MLIHTKNQKFSISSSDSGVCVCVCVYARIGVSDVHKNGHKQIAEGYKLN